VDSVKEQNMFLKNNEECHNKRIKEIEKERSEIKAKLIKQLHVIDLAYTTTEEHTKEIAAKTNKLLDAHVTITELNRKIEQFRSSTFVLDHMISSQKPQKNVKGVGYNEVPPLLVIVRFLWLQMMKVLVILHHLNQTLLIFPVVLI